MLLSARLKKKKQLLNAKKKLNKSTIDIAYRNMHIFIIREMQAKTISSYLTDKKEFEDLILLLRV